MTGDQKKKTKQKNSVYVIEENDKKKHTENCQNLLV